MKKITLAVLLLSVLLISALAWAGTDPNPADYTVNVHVSSSNIDTGSLRLNAVIDGKNYELQGYAGGSLLALGDYKAKLLEEKHKTSYEFELVYEFLFPDKKVAKFTVLGQWE